jgi:DNA mismatch endonuclease (patch repair protein)
MDVHTVGQRSRNMSAIKSSNTKPEMRVRSLLHAMGYRFRLHRKDLPGKPDIVLPKFRTVIFVHGCFWHSHDCRWGKVVPKTRPDFWKAKRGDTVRRDERNINELLTAGWRVIVIWECSSRSQEELKNTLSAGLKAESLRDNAIQ